MYLSQMAIIDTWKNESWTFLETQNVWFPLPAEIGW